MKLPNIINQFILGKRLISRPRNEVITIDINVHITVQHSTALEMKCHLWINATTLVYITEKVNAVIVLECYPVAAKINWKSHTDPRLRKKLWILVEIKDLK